ncbi:MAG TPA: metallophosphoesterase [Gaiellaceae bacterium]|nr:metallophosphoesterase [Gaiellaceae bacterium]
MRAGRQLILLALAGLVLSGASNAGPAPPVRVIAFGDFGVGGQTQRSFGAAIRRFEARNPADLVLTLGDNDYTESPSAFHANWEGSFGWTRDAGVSVAGVLGNHDVRVNGGRYEFDELGMPRRYYGRVVGPVELYLLDSNSVDAAQTAWLARALRGSRAKWKLAAFHHPAFTCGTYSANPAVVARWVPLFERYHVRLVLSGHDHNYQRFAPLHGVRYVVHGGGSPTKLYGLRGCPKGYPRRVRGRVENGFLYLVVRANRLDGWAVRPGGRRTDHFTLAG